MKLYKCLSISLLFCFSQVVYASAQADTRWRLTKDGQISWSVGSQIPHFDHIEMSGKRISAVIRYGVDSEGAFKYSRSLVFPMLRTIPNDTHASLTRRLGFDVVKTIAVNGTTLDGEKVDRVVIGGTIDVYSHFLLSKGAMLELTRTMAPSTSLPLFCESYTLKNSGNRELTVEVPNGELAIATIAEKGVDGSYVVLTKIAGGGTKVLRPNEELKFGLYFMGYKKGEAAVSVKVDEELNKRNALISELHQKLVLETPDSVVNTMFAFAKVRASESIYETKGGPMHGPGGESYYAAIWANDQAEYVGPFFPYLGYDYGNKASLNAYRHFARYINSEFRALPSSIIAEGTDIWAGAGDRGDAAMVAYGAARYALARGDRSEAVELWPLIEWCLEYCNRKLNGDGVVTSDSDELENRFPAGKANLSTSSLYYDALISASYLGKSIGIPQRNLEKYRKQAERIRTAINSYFKGPVEGFDTYRYYKENSVLRSWICIPLTVGIFEKKEATINALFSPRLWTENGLLTQAGSETYWDRSTLYALRGVFASGEADRGGDYLAYYSKKRLLGEHVPYAIEAYPEGNQRHLSAESGLYCRVITEGMFGIRPVGLHSFELTPRLPQKWNFMNLRRVMAFGACFDIEVTRSGEKLKVTITGSQQKNVYEMTEGETITINAETL